MSRKKTRHLFSLAAFYLRVRHYTSTRWHAWWRLSPIQRKLGRNSRSNLRVYERRLPSIESNVTTNRRTYGSLLPEHHSGKKYRAKFFGHLKQHSLYRERSSIQLSVTCWMSHCILRRCNYFPMIGGIQSCVHYFFFLFILINIPWAWFLVQNILITFGSRFKLCHTFILSRSF